MFFTRTVSVSGKKIGIVNAFVLNGVKKGSWALLPSITAARPSRIVATRRLVSGYDYICVSSVLLQHLGPLFRSSSPTSYLYSPAAAHRVLLWSNINLHDGMHESSDQRAEWVTFPATKDEVCTLWQHFNVGFVQ